MEDDIKALNLFNEKAEKLAQLSFTQIMFSQKTKVDMVYEAGKGFKVSRVGPGSENIDAIALTLRFFMQDREPSSIRNLSKIYERLSISQEIKDKFNKARISLNNYLDSESLIKIIFAGKSLTNRDILNTFMYGGLAHSNHKERYDEWMKSPIAPLFTNEFCAIVAEMVRIISFYIAKFNQLALEELAST